MNKVLITGASGFVGRYLVNKLIPFHEVTACVRKKDSYLPGEVEQLINNNFFDIDVPIHTDTIIHLAGIAHAKHNTADEFHKINVVGTLKLAHKAIDSNVKRFIYISSIGVNGNATKGKPFTEQDTPNPTNEYTLSKYNAEKELTKLFQKTNIDLVIIRPPLIYAYDAPGNFSKMLMLVKLGQFLPFDNVNNKRSFIAVENLVSFINACVSYDKPINETFVIADDEQISTKQLICSLSSGMGKSIVLLTVPTKIVTLLGNAIGKSNFIDQLYGDLQIDNRKAKEHLNWQPIKNTLEALEEVGRNYRNNKND